MQGKNHPPSADLDANSDELDAGWDADVSAPDTQSTKAEQLGPLASALRATAPASPSARAAKAAPTLAALRATPVPRSVRPIPSLTQGHPTPAPAPQSGELDVTTPNAGAATSSPTAPTAPDTPVAIAAAIAASEDTTEADVSASAPPASFSRETPISLKLPPEEGRASETLRPSHLEVVPTDAPSARAAWPKWAAVAAIVVVAGIGAVRIVSIRQAALREHKERAAVQAAKPESARVAPALLPAPQAPSMELPSASAAPEPAPPSSAAGEKSTPELQAAFAAALSAVPGMVQVTVNVAPKGAIVFDHGKRIGTNVVHVNVEPGQSKNLVAILDGYQPRKFVVSSSEPVVNINLKPASGAESGVAPTPGAEPGAAPKPSKAKPFDPSSDVGSL
jgi:hypothetical protein